MSPEPSSEQLIVDARIDRAGFSLDLRESLPLDGVTAVFGPSGSGKSTLLRAIAGFTAPGRGRIVCAGEVWFDAAGGVDRPPRQRPVGMMFQTPTLFPHLDVAGNLAYAERRARRREAGIDRTSVVEALDLRPLLARRVGALSGGERQRVALGRTLLSAPRLLLLDEPLAALDRGRKAEILPYLEALHRRFHLPTLYVTHDIDEVARLADRMLVLGEGRVQLHGSVASVVERMALEPMADRFEAGVVLEGQVEAHDPRLHLTRVNVAGDRLILPTLERTAPGERIRLRIRARDVSIAVGRPERISIRNVVPGTISGLTVDDRTGSADVAVRLQQAHVRARVTLAAVEELELSPGLGVFVLIKSVSFDGPAER